MEKAVGGIAPKMGTQGCYLATLDLTHVTGDHIPGDKTCLYKHFGGAKALFSYINLQVTDSVGGGKTMQNFLFGGNAPVPPCRYVPVVYM